MVRVSILLSLGLLVMSCSLVSAFESPAELIAVANTGQALYSRFILWKSNQPVDGDTSFGTFYDSIKGEAENRQLAQREIDETAPTDTIELGHDNGELQNLYEEWKKIQPEGSSDSFESYLVWLKDQRTLRELGAEGGNAAENAVIEKRACSWQCWCCPFKCGIRCNW